MAGNPVAKVLFDWDMNGNFTGTFDDCSALLGDDPGTDVLSIDRGANFEGSGATAGQASIRLQNRDNRFTAGYASSPIAGKVVPGVPVRLQGIYSGTTYPLFEGRVNRFSPSAEFGSRVVDVSCEDDMRKMEKRKVSLALAETRSIADFRAAMLAQIGFTAGQYSLSGSGAEMGKPPTSADGDAILDVMAALNEATRSIDFMRPLLAGGSQYVTKDRTTMIGQDAAATYPTADAAFDSWDVTGESKTNYQLVQAEPYVSSTDEEELWRASHAYTLAAGAQKIRIAKWSDPLILGKGRRPAERTRHEADLTGTASVSITYYSTSARIVLDGGASGGSVRNLTLFGYPADQTGLGYVESDRSSGDLAGRFDGDDVSSRFLASDDEAQGLADYLTWIGTQPPLTRPVVFFRQDMFPDILQREPGEKIIVSDARRGIVAQAVVIESISLRMAAGGHWRLSAPARSVPTVSFVQIGGDAAHGIGGSAIVGY